MKSLKAGFSSLMVMAAMAVHAASASIEMQSFPTMSVADGRSTVTISATIRDNDGRLVPDGTNVIFSCDRGTFREPIVATQNGVARAILQAGDVAGMAKITASAISFSATATLDYEFVSDRSMLSSAKEYIELSSPTDLRYSLDRKIMEASGADRTAVLTYRDIEIRADDIQVTIPTYEVRAKNAILKIGDEEVECGQLYFRMAQRFGFGSTTYKYRPQSLQPFGSGVRLVDGDERETFGVAEIRPGQIKPPGAPVPPQLFVMQDIGDSATLIAARHATAYPRKEVQFQRASIIMGGATVMRMPLYVVSMYTNTPQLTDSMIKINDNQLAIDYPHYLSLRPGHTSLLRLSMGRSASRGVGGSRGIFLDYEMLWNKGDEMMGSAKVQSLGRTDWGITAQQYFKLNQHTDLSAQLDLPAHRSLFGSVALSSQLPGYQLYATANHNQTISGERFQNGQLAVSLEKNPIKIKGTPIDVRYGLTASRTITEGSGVSAGQSVAGIRGVARLSPVYFSSEGSLNANLNVSKLYGSGTTSGLSIAGNLTASQGFRGGGLAVSYDYVDDGYTSKFLGRHQLSGRLNYFMGNAALNAFLLQSIDVDRMSMQIDASYRFSRDWRISYAYTYDRYLSEGFLDYNFILGYRIGYREVGLTWSFRTKRFGFQVLGTTFN